MSWDFRKSILLPLKIAFDVWIAYFFLLFAFVFFFDSCLLFYNINDDRISIGTKLVAVPKLRSADALVLVIRVGQRGRGTGG